MPLVLDDKTKPCVVAGFEEFVSKIDLKDYEQIKPNRGRVILKCFEDKPGEYTSGGGIIVADQKNDPQHVAVVVAVGAGLVMPGFGDAPVDFKVGDVVLVAEHFGHEVLFGPQREKLISQLTTDVIATL